MPACCGATPGRLFLGECLRLRVHACALFMLGREYKPMFIVLKQLLSCRDCMSALALKALAHKNSGEHGSRRAELQTASDSLESTVHPHLRFVREQCIVLAVALMWRLHVGTRPQGTGTQKLGRARFSQGRASDSLRQPRIHCASTPPVRP